MADLKSGSTGTDVVKLQQALNKYFAAKYGASNQVKLKEDGQFGDGTDKAVKQFQTENNLKADGVVGSITLAKLNSLATAAPASSSASSTSSTTPIGFTAADEAKFAQITTMVIDNLEGGYYHPSMNSPQGKLKKHYDYLDSSGETMFGIDRLNGKGDLANNPSWAKFWGIMDTAGASSKWDYNFKGGEFKDQLTQLAIEIMAPQFMKLVKLYLKDNWTFVARDRRLLFHFSYATWNGSGWFKKFANDINTEVAAGKTDPDHLAQVALDSRLKEGLTEGSAPNSLIVQSGKKIETLFQTTLA